MKLGADTLRKGKKAELYVFSELISQGAEVYLPIMDYGVDAIVKSKNGTYSEIQVKATQNDEQAGCFNVRDIQALKRPNYFVVCVDMNEKMAIDKGKPNVWVVPACKFIEYSQAGPKGKEKHGYRLAVYSRNRKHGNIPTRDLIESFRNNWEKLIR